MSLQSSAPDVAARIQVLAEQVGFDFAGVARPDPSDHLSFFQEWLCRGLHGEMAYLERSDAVARRGEIRLTMADVRSIVVVAHQYRVEDPPGVPEDPSLGVIARYARGRDYHKVVRGRLLRLLERIRADVAPEVRGHAYVDTGPILERELAERAGLGWFGKNTMLIHPRRGSWFFLGCLLLDMDFPHALPIGDHCGTCSRCLDACPTGALLGRDESGAPVIDARRCISYLTIEHRGSIPEELRPLLGNRVFGCDICQEVCPFNERFAEETKEPAYAARGPGERPFGVEAEGRAPHPKSAAAGGAPPWHPGTEAPSLVELLETALDEERWDAFSRGSAIRRAGRAGFARNVCVAIGNWGSEEAIPVLSLALADPEPLVRKHAAWALGRVGEDSTRAVLRTRLPLEDDVGVREEVRKALS
jgi:epoxyqueuosine reductase